MSNIVTFPDRLPAQSKPALDPDRRAQEKAYLAQHFAAPAFKALPFVTLKEPEERTGGFGDGSSWWNDAPTDNCCADYRRGKAYAQMAVAAIAVDACHVRALELVFEHIYLDAIRRREKGGKYSRSMPNAAQGFLSEIAKVITVKAGGW